jgi:adenosine deaminase
MSHLSYLSKSVSLDMHLTGKMVKNVILPESTKNAIMEDDLEDDYASEEDPTPDESQEKGE